MFKHLKSILFCTRKQLTLSHVETGGSPHVVQETSLVWNERNLKHVLTQLIEEHKTVAIRVLFDTGVFYEMDISIPIASGDEKQKAFVEIQKMIPEHIEISDCRIAESSRTESEIQYSICVPIMSLWNQIRETMDELDVKIESRESVTLARALHENPIIGLALQKKSNIELLAPASKKNHEVPSDPIQQSQTTSQKGTKMKRKKTVLTLIILILLVLIAGMSYVLFKNISFKTEQKIQTEPTPVIKPTQIPTPTITRSDFIIEVLNATGIAGEAGKVATELKAAGFIQVETGNATESDQGKNIIRVKDATASAMLINSVKNILTDYKFDVADASLEDDQIDLQIIVGERSI